MSANCQSKNDQKKSIARLSLPKTSSGNHSALHPVQIPCSRVQIHCSVARHVAMDILFVSDLSPAFADYAASSLLDFLRLAMGDMVIE